MSYLQKLLEHAQTHMVRLQVITISDFAENNITMQCLGYQTTCYRNLSWQRKAWNESTNCIDQKTLTDHKPKRIRKYDGTHVNIASYITDSNMAETEL